MFTVAHHIGLHMPIEVVDVITGKTDEEGRLEIGEEYADQLVTAALLNIKIEGPESDELSAAFADAVDETVSDELRSPDT